MNSIPSSTVSPTTSEPPATTSAGTGATGPAGINVVNVTKWFHAHVPDAVGPLEFSLVAGGRSNYTYLVDDAVGHRFVLRRPPLGHLLPSAHDVAREHRIISALADTSVPVAPAIGFCDDPSVNERPFYVMSFVDGLVLRNADDARLLDDAAKVRASESVADVLADLHALDVDAVGLGNLGKREGYLERQLKRWYGQFQQSSTYAIPAIHDVHAELCRRVPQQQSVSIVHGDYRLDNTMVNAHGDVMAVLDWELCTLGDPLADVGLLLVYWPEPDDPNPPLGAAASSAPGFLGRQALRTRYAQRTGRSLRDLDVYVAFGYWKLACILDGVYARYRAGAMGDDGYDWQQLEVQVPLLATSAANALEGLS
jgi:aminoglycoside phosphotransferase (APT) family kinase protein